MSKKNGNESKDVVFGVRSLLKRQVVGDLQSDRRSVMENAVGLI